MGAFVVRCRALERVQGIDAGSVDAAAQCRSIVAHLMGDTRIELAEFAVLAGEFQQINFTSGTLTTSGLVKAIDAIKSGSVVSDPRTRAVLECIAVSRETRPELLARACRMSKEAFLTLLREQTGHDVRYWTRMARVRRGLCRILSGDKLDYAAEVSGFANADQMSRDIKDVLGATVTEIRAGVLWI